MVNRCEGVGIVPMQLYILWLSSSLTIWQLEVYFRSMRKYLKCVCSDEHDPYASDMLISITERNETREQLQKMGNSICILYIGSTVKGRN